MIVRIRLSLLTLLFACASAFAQTPTPDPCEALLPASFRDVLPKKFPGYRLARVSDYLKEDVDQHKKEHNGDPCLGVGFSDVDGDGFPDFSFFLPFSLSRGPAPQEHVRQSKNRKTLQMVNAPKGPHNALNPGVR